MVKSKLNIDEVKFYEEGVTAIAVTLNNEHDIEGMLQSLIKNSLHQIIIVDGGSTDKTVEIAKKYSSDVYVTKKGIANQLLFGIKKVKHKYLLSVECDHRYPDDFLNNLYKEYKESNFLGIQATLKCIDVSNFFEKGLSLFYDIHQLNKGKREMIAGPHLFSSKEYIEILNVQDFNGFSIDTKIADNLKKKNYLVGLGHTVAYQYEKMNFATFCHKYFNYGKGDYDYYISHKKEWSLNRKYKSIFHIFNRYIIDYPIKSFKVGKPHLAISYLWLSAIVRYSGWVYRIFKNPDVSK